MYCYRNSNETVQERNSKLIGQLLTVIVYKKVHKITVLSNGHKIRNQACKEGMI